MLVCFFVNKTQDVGKQYGLLIIDSILQLYLNKPDIVAGDKNFIFTAFHPQ